MMRDTMETDLIENADNRDELCLEARTSDDDTEETTPQPQLPAYVMHS